MEQRPWVEWTTSAHTRARATHRASLQQLPFGCSHRERVSAPSWHRLTAVRDRAKRPVGHGYGHVKRGKAASRQLRAQAAAQQLHSSSTPQSPCASCLLYRKKDSHKSWRLTLSTLHQHGPDVGCIGSQKQRRTERTGAADSCCCALLGFFRSRGAPR